MTLAAKWVVESWAEDLKTALQFLTAEEWGVTVSVADSASASSGYFWWTQYFNAAPDAAVSIGAPPLAWSELGARILQAAGVDLIEQASARSTYLEAIQQSTSGLARSLTSRLSRTVEPGAGQEEPPSGHGKAFTAIISNGDLQLSPLQVIVSEELCEALDPRGVSVIPAAAARATDSLPPPSRNMSVLLDVQMPVSISFGRSSMPLREVMKLTMGSAVELDRRPDDPVDVIVNNCVIARGDVVVIEGNYGVRITEIVSREQRLALRAGVRSC